MRYVSLYNDRKQLVTHLVGREMCLFFWKSECKILGFLKNFAWYQGRDLVVQEEWY